MKQNATSDTNLLKRSSLDIQLLPENDEDKRVAALLSKKLDTSRSITENTALIRKNIIASPSLPSTFDLSKEKKAMKVLASRSITDIGIKRSMKSTDIMNEPDRKKTSLVEYTSSSDTD